MKRDRLFIGIDSGTQGTKAVVFSELKGSVVAESISTYPLVENERGGKEQDPAVWIAACKNVILSVCESESVNVADICGIGVSGQQHGLVALDKNGEVIRPAKLWCDTETVAECDEITQILGGKEAMAASTGNALAVGFTASKLLWLKKHEPENFAKIDSVLLPHDYINFWLTGEKVAEFGDASGTGYFDVRKRCWAGDVIDAIDTSGLLREALPRLIDAGETVGRLRSEIATEFGLSEKVIISSGGGDNMMGAIGSGNVSPGVITLSLGTSGTIYGYSDVPVVDDHGELAAFCSSSGGWLPLVCTMNVTVATELTRNLLRLDLEAMNENVKASPPGAGGLLLLPYFQGERTPALPEATATLFGMSSSNYTPANVARAAMEGATFGLRYGLDVMIRNGMKPSEIRLTGGGAKSSVWRQLVADVLRCSVVTLENEEAGALGAAIQAMWTLDNDGPGKTDLVELTDMYVRVAKAGSCDPDNQLAESYDDIYGKFLELNGKMYG